MDRSVDLYAGNITHWTLAQELAEAARHWPANWSLVIHGWAETPAYLEKLRPLCDGQHIILSEEIVPYGKLDDLVSSADIGIALYKGIDRNIHDIGQSSGKMWQYLRCGLPVITTDLPSLQPIVDEGKFGLCVHQAEEVQVAIEQIMSDYAGYAARACEYYRRYGDFAENFKPVLARIEALCGR